METGIKGGFILGAQVLIPGSQGPQVPWASTYDKPLPASAPEEHPGAQGAASSGVYEAWPEGSFGLPPGWGDRERAALQGCLGQDHRLTQRKPGASPRLRKSSETRVWVGWVGRSLPAAILAPSSLPPPPCPPGHIPATTPPRLRGMCLFYPEPRKRQTPWLFPLRIAGIRWQFHKGLP